MKVVTPVYDDAERWSVYQSVHYFIRSKTAFILSQLNILRNSLIKPCHGKNDDSPVIHRSQVTAILRVLQRIFHLSGVFHISKRSVLSREHELCFEFYRTWIFFAQVPWNDTMLKWQFIVQVSPVFQCTGVHGSKKNLPPRSSDLILVNSLLWRALQHKLYRSLILPRRWSCINFLFRHFIINKIIKRSYNTHTSGSFYSWVEFTIKIICLKVEHTHLGILFTAACKPGLTNVVSADNKTTQFERRLLHIDV